MFNRRKFLQSATVCTFALTSSLSKFKSLLVNQKVKLGVIADLHQDIMHDGLERMQAFVNEVKIQNPDAILQLGDFAYPSEKNKHVIQLFNNGHDKALHVIGNHDTDDGHTVEECLNIWGMPSRYYHTEVDGLNIIVLDGNDTGSPIYEGGYPSYIGIEQKEWLRTKLSSTMGPVVIVSHQPIAGAFAIDNGAEIQELLSTFSDRILFAMNGHSHVNQLLRVGNINYVHINSASYLWVGSNFEHESYSSDIHLSNPTLARTCPYKSALFAFIEIDLEKMQVSIKGRATEWVGQSPSELKVDNHSFLIYGEEVAPKISDWNLQRTPDW